MEKLQFLSKEEKARIAELLKRIREVSRNFEITIRCDLTFQLPFTEACFYGQWLSEFQKNFIEIDNILARKEGGEA